MEINMNDSPVGDSTARAQTNSDRFGEIFKGLPLEIYHFFNLPIGGVFEDEVKNLETIFEYFKGKDIQETLMSTKIAEKKLGAPHQGETRITHLNGFIKLVDSLGKDKAEQIMFEKA